VLSVVDLADSPGLSRQKVHGKTGGQLIVPEALFVDEQALPEPAQLVGYGLGTGSAGRGAPGHGYPGLE
jgi:hypothetical protein